MRHLGTRFEYTGVILYLRGHPRMREREAGSFISCPIYTAIRVRKHGFLIEKFAIQEQRLFLYKSGAERDLITLLSTAPQLPNFTVGKQKCDHMRCWVNGWDTQLPSSLLLLHDHTEYSNLVLPCLTALFQSDIFKFQPVSLLKRFEPFYLNIPYLLYYPLPPEKYQIS